MDVTSHCISVEKKISHTKSLLPTFYLFLSFTSNSVNAKLWGKSRRMYWLNVLVSKKNSSMSAVLAAKKEKLKSLDLNYVTIMLPLLNAF